jgi:hypothetical protein
VPGTTAAAQPVSSATQGEKFPRMHQLLEYIYKWIGKNLTTPEFQKFTRTKLEMIFRDCDNDGDTALLPDFVLPGSIAREHTLIMAYLQLYSSQQTLSQCEYYFRRFPFSGLPVSRNEHLKNVCEFYFSLFYIIKERSKDSLNRLKDLCPDNRIQITKSIGAYVRLFEKTFANELHHRGRVHHGEGYGDIGLDRIFFTGVLSDSLSDQLMRNAFKLRHASAYKKASKEWALCARDRARVMQGFLEIVAGLILTNAAFLKVE